MKNDKIKLIRQKLDVIDDKILELLKQRGCLAKSILLAKEKKGESIFNPVRETEIIRRLSGKDTSPFSPENIRSIFVEIISASRSLETKLKVAYLGPEATYTHQASLEFFGKSADFQPVNQIPDIFREVSRGTCNFGVCPIENSSEGAVVHTLDMLLRSELFITAEFIMPISHCLLSNAPMNRIKKLYSPLIAFAQCRDWLSKHLSQLEHSEVSSTVQGIQKALKEKYAASLGGENAAKLYKIPIRAKNIQDIEDNFTRFLVIGDKVNPPSVNDKTSIAFSIKDKVGALYEMLIPFKKSHINLTKIESRPSRKQAWQYVFFVDFLGHVTDKKVVRALDELRSETVFLKILGSYPALNGVK